MHLTLYSILMANLFVSVFTILFFTFRNNIPFITKFGSRSILTLYLLCIVRIIFPFELPFTKEIYFPKLMNWWNHYLFLYFKNTNIRYINIICFGWMLVAFWLLLHYFFYYFKFLNAIKLFPFVENENIEKHVSKYSSNTNLRYYFVSQNALSSPVQFGIFNPVILFPNVKYSELEFQHICHHECTHIRHKDNLVKALTKILTCIFWWNPFFHLLSKELNRMQEYKCDYIVTQDLSQNERAAYLETLLKFYSTPKNKRFVTTLSYFASSNSRNEMINRFQLIASCKHPHYYLAKYSIIISVLLFLFSYCFVIQPYFEAPNEANLLDGSNTMLKKISPEQYEVIIDGQPLFIISDEQTSRRHARKRNTIF